MLILENTFIQTKIDETKVALPMCERWTRTWSRNEKSSQFKFWFEYFT